ncbi:MAG: class I SAM-dependent methyltransferase [Fibrobacter sp.]|nr:class I SAM-dependent methyltransferase [Fibrobacter sp.]
MFSAELLTSASVQEFIQQAIQKKMDALQVSTALNKAGYSNEERAAIMDYMELVPKFREKFFAATNGENPRGGKIESGKNCAGKDCAKFLLCDKLALEQSTAQDIGRWKSNLWPSGAEAAGKTVHDLCCGMGGDSFFLPSELNVVGVDLDENRLAMYRYNCGIMRGTDAGKVLQADARTVNSGAATADYFTIDPARRAIDGENQRDLRNLTPTFAEVLEIATHYKGGMAKLPPGYPTKEIPADCEVIYIGSHSDCRECLVLFGELAKNPGKVRAVMVDKNGNLVKTAGDTAAEWCGTLTEIQTRSNKNAEKDLPGCERSFRNATSDSDLPVGDLAKYLSEPTALLIRSHLFGSVAQVASPNAHLISEGIAYVTSDTPLPSPAFTSYEVLDHSEISSSAVRAMLKKHDIGKLTLKLRGVKLDPDAEIKRLKARGKNEAILFYTRAAGEKVAILAKKV